MAIYNFLEGLLIKKNGAFGRLRLSQEEILLSKNTYLLTPSKIYLCKPNRKPICVLNGVDINSVQTSVRLQDICKLSFSVDKYITIGDSEIVSDGYDILHAYMEVYVENIGYFKIQEPSIMIEDGREYKTVSGESVDKELIDKDLIGLSINMGTEDSLEMLVDGNVSNAGFRIEPITFYNEFRPELSLLDIVMEKISGWSIAFVDESLKNRVFNFEIDSKNIYAFLTQDVSGSAECIFFFNTIDKTISVYAKENIGEDTGIFISQENLMNTVDINCDSDSIYTRLNVRGEGELNLSAVNFGDLRIFNRDYFMTTDYVSQDIIDKHTYWKNYRELQRSLYIQKFKDYTTQSEIVDEITYRVPNDGCNTYQWNQLTQLELNANLVYYQAELTTMQISVDTTPQYTTDGNYIAWTLNGSINHQAYMNLLLSQNKGYYTYYEILNYIMPNIELAIGNYGLSEENKTPYVEDWDTNFDLYGTVELSTKREAYKEQLMILSNVVILDVNRSPIYFASLTASQKSQNGINESTYDNYCNTYASTKLNLDNCEISLEERQIELNDATDLMNTYISDLENMRNDVDISNVQFGFTTDELNTINILNIDTDYANDNILVTETNTSIEAIDVANDLYLDATEKLISLSQPQYNFSTTIDNLYNMIEFYDWKIDFKVGNFIRVAIRDGYVVKFRLSDITFNPCDAESELSVTYTNMVRSKNGLNDFTTLFDSTISAQKNSISYASTKATGQIELTAELLQKISNSSQISSKISNSQSATSTDTELKTSTVVGDVIGARKVDAEIMTVTKANVNELFSGDITFTGTITGGSYDGGVDNGVIKSLNYVPNTSGTRLDLVNGSFETSSALLRGDIYADNGYIGGVDGFTIDTNAIRNGKTTFADYVNQGVYISTSGISIGDALGGWIGIDIDGTMELRRYNELGVLLSSNRVEPDLINIYTDDTYFTTISDGLVLCSGDILANYNPTTTNGISLATIGYDSGWIAPTILASFQNSDVAISYRKLGKHIELRGSFSLISGTLSGSRTIFTLPDGYRPTTTRRYVARTSTPTTMLAITVNTTGVVTIQAQSVTTTPTYINFTTGVVYYLDQVSFLI